MKKDLVNEIDDLEDFRDSVINEIQKNDIQSVKDIYECIKVKEVFLSYDILSMLQVDIKNVQPMLQKKDSFGCTKLVIPVKIVEVKNDLISLLYFNNNGTSLIENFVLNKQCVLIDNKRIIHKKSDVLKKLKKYKLELIDEI